MEEAENLRKRLNQ